MDGVTRGCGELRRDRAISVVAITNSGIGSSPPQKLLSFSLFLLQGPQLRLWFSPVCASRIRDLGAQIVNIANIEWTGPILGGDTQFDIPQPPFL